MHVILSQSINVLIENKRKYREIKERERKEIDTVNSPNSVALFVSELLFSY